jgi:hypothetical protein
MNDKILGLTYQINLDAEVNMTDRRTNVFINNCLARLSSKTKGLNNASLKLLVDNAGNLTPFVGAGLSAPFGFPTWHSLLEQLSTSLGMEGEIKSLLEASQFEEAAERLEPT